MCMNDHLAAHEWLIEDLAAVHGMPLYAMRGELERAMWAGDIERLDEIARCRCCCHEHTFEWCYARIWGGCRGQHTMTRAEERSWVEHYRRFHGMTEDEFWGY